MAIGASLWGFYNQTGEFGFNLTKPTSIGCQYGYQNLMWMPESSVFDKARATGLRVHDWQDAIMVNMLGQRFYDETGLGFTTNNYNSIDPYTQGSWLNAKNVKYNPHNWLNAAMAGITAAARSGRSSMRMPWRASTGTRCRPTWTWRRASSSPPTHWPTSRGRS